MPLDPFPYVCDTITHGQSIQTPAFALRGGVVINDEYSPPLYRNRPLLDEDWANHNRHWYYNALRIGLNQPHQILSWAWLNTQSPIGGWRITGYISQQQYDIFKIEIQRYVYERLRAIQADLRRWQGPAPQSTFLVPSYGSQWNLGGGSTVCPYPLGHAGAA